VEDNQGVNDPSAAAESVQARALLQRAFPDQRGIPAIVVLRNADGLSPADLREVRRISDASSGHRPPAWSHAPDP
jgi:putative drug exporter of the RND superfamily